MMSYNPDAASSMAENAVVPARNGFESVMVNIGSLVAYLAVYIVKHSFSAAGYAFDRIRKSIRPLFAGSKKKIRYALRKIEADIEDTADSISASYRRFFDRVKENGFGKALLMQLSDLGAAVKSSGKFAATVVNHVVPVLGISVLVFVVADKASADYGVTVEYNGQELGVVSEESVIDEAQQVIADRMDYYDTGSETYITATLSLKPLSAYDNVIDEQTLAAVIQEQIETQAPAGEPDVYVTETETVSTQSVEEDNSNKVRAFTVTVDGKFIGAVESTDEIAEYLEAIKETYEGDDIVEVSFDKDIEYTYENYVDEDQLLDQSDIIDMFESVVSEPVYYEIQNGDNPWNIAHNNDMELDELLDCFITFEGEQITDLTKFCPVGAIVQLSEEVPYLGVLTTKEITYSQTIDYEIVYENDDNMYKGETSVSVSGVEGEKEVTAYVTYKNDVAVSREIIEENIISEPVTKIVKIGTRETRTPVSTGSGGSGNYFWPVDGGYISAYQGDGRGHKGIDIAAPYGTPIYAAESGTVIETGSGWNGGYGNCVQISHADGNVTLYGHQSSIAIEYGDYVVKGQIIGYVGSTGDSSGNHLHFEVRSNGKYIDPLDYIAQY